MSTSVIEPPALDSSTTVAAASAHPAPIFGETPEAVTDHRALFVHSGLVDQLRDTTGSFIAQGVDDPAASARLAAQFELLRLRAAAAMDEAVAVDLDLWAPPLPEAPTVAELHAAAAMLARWIDQVHAAPQYLTQHRMATVAARRVIRELGDGDEGDGIPASAKVPADAVPQAGLYL